MKIAGSVVLWAVLVVALMVAAAYAWVWVYANFVFPDGSAAFYEAYAQRASPVVAIVVAAPVFFLMARFMRRFGQRALLASLSVLSINLIMDAAAVSTMADDVAYTVLLSVAAFVMKGLGIWLALRNPSLPAHG